MLLTIIYSLMYGYKQRCTNTFSFRAVFREHRYFVTRLNYQSPIIDRKNALAFFSRFNVCDINRVQIRIFKKKVNKYSLYGKIKILIFVFIRLLFNNKNRIHFYRINNKTTRKYTSYYNVTGKKKRERKRDEVRLIMHGFLMRIFLVF